MDQGQQSLVAHNVVFKKIGHVSLTRSEWTLSFVIDMKPYLTAMSQLENNINETSNKIWEVANYYFNTGSSYGPNQKLTRMDHESTLAVRALSALGDEVRIIKDTYSDL